MQRLIPEKLSDTFTVYRKITLKDSLVILLMIIVSLLLLKVKGRVGTALIITTDLMLGSLLTTINGEKLYITLIYIIRYFMYEKISVYLLDMKNNGIEKRIESGFDNLVVSKISSIPFDMLSEEKQLKVTEELSAALRCQEEGKSAYLISLDEDIDADEYKKSLLENSGNLLSAFNKGMLLESEYESRKDIIFSSLSSLDNLKKEKVKIRNFYLITIKEDEALRERIREALLSFASALKDLNEKEKRKVLSLYLGWGKDGRIKAYSGSVKNGNSRESLIYIYSYPVCCHEGFGKDFMTVSGTKVCMEFKKENQSLIKRKTDSALLELSSSRILRESEKLKRERNQAALKNLVSDAEEGDIIHSISAIVRCPEKDRKEVIRALKNKGYKAGVRYGRNYEILKKYSFLVSSFKEKHFVSSSLLASSFPFSSMALKDEKGVLTGAADGPVIIDFLKRDEMHLNSNMVVIGKSGSGKSYFVKSLLASLSCNPSRIFILDPEGEYEKLTESLGGEVLRIGSDNAGVINPFEIRGENSGGAFYSHLQFLEQFYSLLFDGMDPSLLESLNSFTLSLYRRAGINKDSDFNSLPASSFPSFTDLYSLVKEEKGSPELLSYLSKVSEGGMNSNILCGKTDITMKRCVTDFSFLSLLSGGNRKLINANLLVILKFLENEVLKSKLNPYVTAIAIDEAHLFIDEKYPAALDFMYRMAKRIRKYNGMQIVITQNLKDFSLSGEIKRKSEALISVSQYSLVFSSSPQDVKEITELYKASGGINKKEQDIISHLKLGEAFFIKNPEIRTAFKVVTPSLTEEKFL